MFIGINIAVNYGVIALLKGFIYDTSRSYYAEKTEIRDTDKTKIRDTKNRIIRLKTLSTRLEFFSYLGSISVAGRIKAGVVSLINTKGNWFFGNGAGLSIFLLPEMFSKFDQNASKRIRDLMITYYQYGKASNRQLVDAHNLFITEFFHVGLFGLIPLCCFITFVLIEQLKLIKRSPESEQDYINEILFATLIALIFHRLTAGLVTIPFLWFMLGLSFGACRLRWKKHAYYDVIV